MEKMFYALSAIGAMFASNFAITWARKMNGTLFRFVLSTIAYISLLVAFVLMVAVLINF